MHPNLNKITNKMISMDKRKLSVLIIAIAFVLAFTSIEVEKKESSIEGNIIKYPENDTYNKYFVILPKYLDEIDNTLFLSYSSNNSVNATINIKDHDGDILRNVTISTDESENYELSEEAYYLSPSIEEGRVYYKYSVTYYSQPFSFLAIPAFILTIIGIYLFIHEQMRKSIEKKIEENSKG